MVSALISSLCVIGRADGPNIHTSVHFPVFPSFLQGHPEGRPSPLPLPRGLQAGRAQVPLPGVGRVGQAVGGEGEKILFFGGGKGSVFTDDFIFFPVQVVSGIEDFAVGAITVELESKKIKGEWGFMKCLQNSRAQKTFLHPHS